MLTSSRLRRTYALLLFAMLSVIRVDAKLTLSADVEDKGEACPGEAIVMQVASDKPASEAARLLYTYETSNDEKNWLPFQSATHSLKATTDMPDGSDYIYFRVVSNGGEISNTVKVKLSTNPDCGKTCHQTSTGDFFNGTDFDPLDGNNEVPAIPNEIVQFFGDGEAPVYFHIQDRADYHVTSNIKEYFKGQTPSIKDYSENYFFTYDHFSGGNKPFIYEFPYEPWHDKHYSFVMRFYMLPKSGCGDYTNAQLKLETPQGNFGSQQVNCKVFIDATGELISETNTVAPSFGSALLNIGDVRDKLLRIEATFYGKFPHTGQDNPGGPWNNNDNFKMFPYFQQIGGDGCVKIAIDYISAEIESVCLTKGTVCKGEHTTINAAGFASGSVFTWEHLNKNGEWEIVTHEGSNQPWTEGKLNLKVDFIGKEQYRVYSEYKIVDKDTIQNEVNHLYFSVSGKDCDPTAIDTIEGPDKICTPYGATQSVVPVDINPDIVYHWLLTDPKGKQLDNTVIYQEEANVRGTSITINLPKGSVEGKYILECSMWRKTNNPKVPLESVGVPKVKEIMVYNSPEAHFKVDGFVGGGKDSICASDVHKELHAIDNSKLNPDHKYIYTWFNGKADSKNPAEAIITWSDEDHKQMCSGTKNSHWIKETVEIEGIGCPESFDTTLSVSKPKDPKIECDQFDKVTEIILEAKQHTTTIKLPLPEVTGSCDPNPKVVISGEGKDVNGNDLKFKIEANLLDLKGEKADLLIREIAATAGPAPADNGLVVTYYVIDGCDKNSNACPIKFIVRDVTAPDVACNEIKDYTTYLSYYEKMPNPCLAYPGQGLKPEALPELVAPELWDMNTPDTKIKGEFVGRLDNYKVSKPAPSPDLFKNSSIKLNDPIPAGYTYILWKFEDKSKNASYCVQRITVIDDKEPVVSCPDKTMIDVSVQDGTDQCGLSTDSLLAKLGTNVPSAKETCPVEQVITKYQLFFRELPNGKFVQITDNSELIFKLNKQYEVEWRFFKVNNGLTVDHNVYAACQRQFHIVDNIAPVPPCDLLKDTVVTVNTNTKTGKDEMFASGGEEKPKSDIIYSLEGFFSKIPLAYDACDGDIFPTVTIIDPKGKEHVISNVTNVVDFQSLENSVKKKLENFHFEVGLSKIVYTYTDSKGNTDSCAQNIIVYERMSLNCVSEIEIPVDDKCIGHYDITPEDVATARVAYVRQYVRKMYYQGNTNKVDVTKDDVRGPEEFFNPGFNNLLSRSPIPDSTISVFVDVYPYKVKKVTNVSADGKETAQSKTTEVNNTSKLEEREWKCVRHDFCNDPMCWNFDSKKQVYKNLSFRTGTFTKDFTDDFKTFEKGTHKLVWYYENDQEGKNAAVDSCVVIVSVVDTTSPKVTCGNWEKNISVKSDPVTCQAALNLNKPTVDDLKASDNCTEADKLVIDFEREFNGTVSHSLTDPFEQGTTLITWIVSDESDNKSYCKQNVIVRDSTPPQFDCKDYIVTPINVVADEDCEVKNAVMIKAGLATPILKPEAERCSPTKDPIKGVGYREDVNGVKDGKDIFTQPYELGTTYIVWTFKDSLGNAKTCRQTVNVEDKTEPDFDCKKIEDNPIVYELPEEDCDIKKDQILVELGNHYATDNCSDEQIVGEKFWFNNGKREPIPAAFKKDTTYVIEWVFTDDSKNEKVCKQKFTVKDTTKPFVDICPDPEKTIKADVTCNITFKDLDLPDLKIEDKCDGEIEGVLSGIVMQPNKKHAYPSSKEEAEALEYYAGSVNYFTWTFTDNGGNSSECKMKLTIEDAIAPKIENCETNNDASYEMSEGVCYAKWEDLSKLIVFPVAYDECQELLSGSGKLPLDPMEIRRYFDGKLVSISTGDDTEWKKDPFERGEHRLVWVFSDDAGNIDSCAKTIRVVNKTKPTFICDSIQPNPYLAKAKPGECSVPFKDLELGTYYGFNACNPNDSIKALPLLAPEIGALQVPDYLEFIVGDSATIYWTVIDKDANISFCPQIIKPSHSNPIAFDCESLDSIKNTALYGECYIPADRLKIEIPFAIDSCAHANGIEDSVIVAVPTRSDGKNIDDDYPTGTTTISWMFVSPFNTDDTLTCQQTVFIKGNKNFDFVCEDILPTIKDTISTCGPEEDLKLVAPVVPDPCLDETVTGKVFARSDDAAEDAPFNLGTTVVTWTFLDGTGAISDTCRQKVIVLTDQPLKTPCSIKDMDTIKVPAPEDACTVPVTDVELGKPYALHPCATGLAKDTVWGVLSRPGITDLSTPYVIGLNRLVWTFTDTTGTLVTPEVTCEQFVKVGSVEVEPVDCKNMPDQFKVLAEGNCTIDFADFNLEIPAVIDRCPNGNPNAEPVEIKPTITRFTDSEWEGHTVADIKPFGLGKDTLYWNYTIAGIEYQCKQGFSIKDSVAPAYNCDLIKPIVAYAKEGECSVDSSEVLALMRPFPMAVETCTLDSIEGIPTVNGKPLPETIKVGDTITVTWTFIDTVVNIKAHTCEQTITVMGNGEPQFDCSKLDTLKFIAQQACFYELKEGDIEIPIARDSCTSTDVPGTATYNGGDVYTKYYTGYNTINWLFKSDFSTATKTCDQVLWIVTDLEIDGNCGLENYPDINEPVSDGVCEVPAEKILERLRRHTAVNPCHSNWEIEGIPSRSDGLKIDANFPVGITTITWTFTDTTNTLLNPVSTCEQKVIVGDDNEPPVDCATAFPDTLIYLDKDNCFADNSQIPNHLAEMPVNACNGDVAELEITRESGKDLKDPFEVGADVVVYTFTFPTNKQKHVCRQKVEVKDTIAPDFDCDKLEPMIIIPLTAGGQESVSYEQIVEKGFKVPVVTDKCCDVTTEVKRNDGKDYKEDAYPMGETTITFYFSDDHGNTKECSQIIKVTDMIPPELTCPKFGGEYTCLTDIPEVFNTWQEFVAAGGKVDDDTRTDFASFRAEDEIRGDSCDAKVIRTYYISSTRGDEVACHNKPDTFLVKDDVAPTFELDGVAFTGKEIEIDCHGFEGVETPNVVAVDNCDPNPQIKMTFNSTQGSDPKLCSYYQFDISYTWTAADRCGNEANTVSYTIHVLNDKKPGVRKPVDWDDVSHPLYLKNCTFGVPSIVDLIPIDSIDLNCGDTRNLSFTQSPEEGTIIDTSVLDYDPVRKEYILPVTLTISDVCGNFETLVKNVVLQPRAQIISLQMGSGMVCAEEENAMKNPRNAPNSLSNDELRIISGAIWTQEFDGEWVMSMPQAVIDVYRSSISENNVKYSDNPLTYGSRFADANGISDAAKQAYAKYNLLTRRHQSDTYYYVAFDTITGCSDTNSLYVDVRERPRIVMETADWNVCDGDTISINTEFKDANPVCIDEMGTPVIKTGWMLNGVEYLPYTPVRYSDGDSQKSVFYATNACGTTYSDSSLFTLCDQGTPVTHEDSLSIFGSEENIKLAKQDMLFAHDSVNILVATHYEPAQVLLTTNPHIKPRVWEGEMAELVVTLPYEEPSIYKWMKVVGEFDGEQGAVYNRDGEVVKGGSGENDDEVLEEINDPELVKYKNRFYIQPNDTSYYYVVVGNGICPSVTSNIVNMDVNHLLPTAFTPYNRDGFNDDFMKGYEVKIFNRYGQLLFEGNDGWDGRYRGMMADPGVYFYEVVLKNGALYKGSIEVVKAQ